MCVAHLVETVLKVIRYISIVTRTVIREMKISVKWSALMARRRKTSNREPATMSVERWTSLRNETSTSGASPNTWNCKSCSRFSSLQLNLIYWLIECHVQYQLETHTHKIRSDINDYKTQWLGNIPFHLEERVNFVTTGGYNLKVSYIVSLIVRLIVSLIVRLIVRLIVSLIVRLIVSLIVNLIVR